MSCFIFIRSFVLSFVCLLARFIKVPDACLRLLVDAEHHAAISGMHVDDDKYMHSNSVFVSLSFENINK